MGNVMRRRSAADSSSSDLSTRRDRQQDGPPKKPTKTPKWTNFRIRKCVEAGVLAPHIKGFEEDPDNTMAECSICFLYFQQLNATECCEQIICTDCLIQVKPSPAKPSPCPFCTKSDVRFRFSEETVALAKASTSRHGSDVDDRQVKEMMEKLANAAKSPPSTFGNMDDYMKRQRKLSEEGSRRLKLLPRTSPQSSSLFRNGPDADVRMRENLIQLLLSSSTTTPERSGTPSSRSTGGGGSGMLAALFGGGEVARSRGSEREERLARTEEMLLLRALQLSLEEAQEREASKGRCDSREGVDGEESEHEAIERVKRLSLREDARSEGADNGGVARSVAAPPTSDETG